MRHAVLVTAPLKSAPVKTEPTTVMIGVKMTAAGRHSRAVGHGAGIRGFLAAFVGMCLATMRDVVGGERRRRFGGGSL
jgi:hypothetical protein